MSSVDCIKIQITFAIVFNHANDVAVDYFLFEVRQIPSQ